MQFPKLADRAFVSNSFLRSSRSACKSITSPPHSALSCPTRTHIQIIQPSKMDRKISLTSNLLTTCPRLVQLHPPQNHPPEPQPYDGLHRLLRHPPPVLSSPPSHPPLLSLSPPPLFSFFPFHPSHLDRMKRGAQKEHLNLPLPPMPPFSMRSGDCRTTDHWVSEFCAPKA